MNKKQISELARGLQALSHKAQIKKYGGKKGYKAEMTRRGKLGGRLTKLAKSEDLDLSTD